MKIRDYNNMSFVGVVFLGRKLNIITGKGIRSIGGICILKLVVRRLLKKETARTEERLVHK